MWKLQSCKASVEYFISHLKKFWSWIQMLVGVPIKSPDIFFIWNTYYCLLPFLTILCFLYIFRFFIHLGSTFKYSNSIIDFSFFFSFASFSTSPFSFSFWHEIHSVFVGFLPLRCHICFKRPLMFCLTADNWWDKKDTWVIRSCRRAYL